MVYFYPQRHTTDTNSVNDIVIAQENRITGMFNLLDKELEGKEFLVGRTITVCDYFLFMLATWADEFKNHLYHLVTGLNTYVI